jgi:hypothetical protein
MLSDEPDEQVRPSQDEAEKEDSAPSKIMDVVEEISDFWKADVYLFSGDIDRESAHRFIEIAEENKSKENAVLVLTTNGGSADSAYRIVRYIKRTYTKFILYVFGPCKSAGTLLALGADQIVMSCWGEFGPLDVQLVKRDDLLFRNSGLDIAEALEVINTHTFSIFENHFIELIGRSGGAISTKTASDIAKSIAIGLLAPITAQIDPLQIGEVGRAVKVASDYGDRLKANPRIVKQLVQGYSSHSFVIDFDEAKGLFENVRLADSRESILEKTLIHATLAGTGHDCIRDSYPHKAMVAFLDSKARASDEPRKEPDTTEHGDTDSPDETESSSSS